MSYEPLDIAPEETCCFTGHRPSRLPWGDDEDDLRCIQFKEILQVQLVKAYDDGIRHFLCGMAQGCDLYFCEGVLALAEERPDAHLWAIIPCVAQCQRWEYRDRLRYSQLLERCHHQVTLQAHYTKDCMHHRNRFMVDHSSLLIAAYDGVPSGGAFYTLAHGLKAKLKVEILEIKL